jgi:hypothetical protein
MLGMQMCPQKERTRGNGRSAGMGKNVQNGAYYGSVGTGCGVQNACILGGEARCVQIM